MILPTRRLSCERSLLAVGGDILALLDEPKTVSRLWDEVRRAPSIRVASAHLSYDWFILALDLLYTLGAIEISRGALRKRKP